MTQCIPSTTVIIKKFQVEALLKIKGLGQPEMEHTYNPSTWEAKTKRLLCSQPVQTK
jgi:hypothetical protein